VLSGAAWALFKEALSTTPGAAARSATKAEAPRPSSSASEWHRMAHGLPALGPWWGAAQFRERWREMGVRGAPPSASANGATPASWAPSGPTEGRLLKGALPLNGLGRSRGGYSTKAVVAVYPGGRALALPTTPVGTDRGGRHASL
jgi:hypothetical protein